MKIKIASKRDNIFFYECRNHISTRNMMVNRKFIKLNLHKKWYNNNLKSSYYYFYKGIYKNKKIGIIVFKIDQLYLNVDISITIHPEFRGKKLSEIFLKKTIKKFLDDYKFNINLIAQIKKKNTQSIKIFANLNFKKFKENKNMIYLKKDAFFENKYFKSKNIGVIVQARQGSKRLPNKVLKKINGFSVIQLLLTRLIRSKTINKLIIAIPNNKNNKKLKDHIIENNIDYYTGNEQNVLKRYYDTAIKNNLDYIVRITSDCALLHYKLLDRIIKFAIKKNVDYVSNIKPKSLPQGFSVEIFKFSALETSYLNAKKNYQKEHVNYYIHENNNFSKRNFFIKNMNFSKRNFSIDFLKDLRFVKSIYRYFFPNLHFGLEDIAKYVKNKR